LDRNHGKGAPFPAGAHQKCKAVIKAAVTNAGY
jgi:hypothetical protein